jgi:FMN phosphatase YigB (HAD superfamily)
MIKAVSFDLDGTLLPLDVDSFCEHYFGMLARHMVPHGYDPKALVGGIMAGTKAMYKNDGSRTNEQAFWDTFCDIFGEDARKDEAKFAVFYENDFDKARAACGFDPAAAPALRACREMGLRVCVATSPLFPRIATYKRLQWAGLDPAEVEFFTTYEDCHYCKPSLGYYREVTARLGLAPEECLMVGNDVREDVVASTAFGMHSFLLLNDYLLNKDNADITAFPRGNFDDMLAHVKELMA